MYSQMSKGIFLFFAPAHTYTVQDSLHLHASNASHIFLELEFVLVTSQGKVLTMYSSYAQMGRHPHKLHLQTPDAPCVFHFFFPPGTPCHSTSRRLRIDRLEMR